MGEYVIRFSGDANGKDALEIILAALYTYAKDAVDGGLTDIDSVAIVIDRILQEGPTRTTLAEKLSALRFKTGLSLREIARRTDVSTPYIAQLESGRVTKPSPDVLRKLAKGYGVPYMELMQDAGYLEE